MEYVNTICEIVGVIGAIVGAAYWAGSVSQKLDTVCHTLGKILDAMQTHEARIDRHQHRLDKHEARIDALESRK